MYGKGIREKSLIYRESKYLARLGHISEIEDDAGAIGHR